MDAANIESSTDYIIVNVSNCKNDSVAFELKYPKSLNVAGLKRKLEVVTGGNAGTMLLELYKGDKCIMELEDNDALLGSLPIDSGMRIHVIDNFSWLSEESVEKFELTDDQYESKNDTVRNFLKSQKLGKYNEEEMRKKEEKLRQQEEDELIQAELCVVGSRCEVTVAGSPKRRGLIMYKGPLEGKQGIFIGVKYDEPLGKNDGSINDKIYFICGPNYGSFVSPFAVQVGDFPPESFEDSDDEEI